MAVPVLPSIESKPGSPLFEGVIIVPSFERLRKKCGGFSSAFCAGQNTPVILFEKGVGDQQFMAIGGVTDDAISRKVRKEEIVDLDLQRGVKVDAPTTMLVVQHHVPEHYLKREVGWLGWLFAVLVWLENQRPSALHLTCVQPAQVSKAEVVGNEGPATRLPPPMTTPLNAETITVLSKR